MKTYYKIYSILRKSVYDETSQAKLGYEKRKRKKRVGLL
jgi:hypothetical protein